MMKYGVFENSENKDHKSLVPAADDEPMTIPSDTSVVDESYQKWKTDICGCFSNLQGGLR